MKEIKGLTFEKACKIKGIDSVKALPDVSSFPKEHRKSLVAYAKLVIMVEVANMLANDGKIWRPDYDDDQPKYEPRFYKGCGGLRFYVYDYWRSATYCGSRLCFVSYDTMIAMVGNKHYMKVYNEYAL